MPALPSSAGAGCEVPLQTMEIPVVAAKPTMKALKNTFVTYLKPLEVRLTTVVTHRYIHWDIST